MIILWFILQRVKWPMQYDKQMWSCYLETEASRLPQDDESECLYHFTRNESNRYVIVWQSLRCFKSFCHSSNIIVIFILILMLCLSFNVMFSRSKFECLIWRTSINQFVYRKLKCKFLFVLNRKFSHFLVRFN